MPVGPMRSMPTTTPVSESVRALWVLPGCMPAFQTILDSREGMSS